MKRKTYTAPEVKNRWNREHYDRIGIMVPIGAKDEIAKVAEAQGMSVSAYIRALIMRDTAENPESTRILRGGGVLESWKLSW